MKTVLPQRTTIYHLKSTCNKCDIKIVKVSDRSDAYFQVWFGTELKYIEDTLKDVRARMPKCNIRCQTIKCGMLQYSGYQPLCY